jgi:Zn-dependent protease
MLPIIVILILFPFATFMHELGHYITARLTGVQTIEIRMGLGPIILKVDQPSLKLEVGLWFFIGAYTIWEGSVRSGPTKRLLIALNGPLINLVIALYSFQFVRFVQSPLYDSYLFIFAMINMWIAIGNFIPYQIKGRKSDGWIILQNLWKVVRGKTVQ